MTSPAEAALSAIYRALPDSTPAERHFVWAFTRHETGWGTGWKDNALGQLSHNWGAVTAPPGQGFTYNDPLNGTDRIHTFKIYPSDEAGIQDAARIALKPNVREALNRGALVGAPGDAWTAIGLMRANGYFEASADSYRAAVKRNYDAARKGTGEPVYLNFDPPSAEIWPWLVATGALVYVFRKQLGLK